MKIKILDKKTNQYIDSKKIAIKGDGSLYKFVNHNIVSKITEEDDYEIEFVLEEDEAVFEEEVEEDIDGWDSENV